jgi:hypothetical protein
LVSRLNRIEHSHVLRDLFIIQGYTIKTESVFSAIREINEILSLTNEPDKLLNTALDTLSQTLSLECCWIQTISDRKNQKLSLSADRGFTDAMRSEITKMGLNHDFAGQIIGMGHKIIIPDLSNDGAYGLGSFPASGYKWLAAVPLMTYRAWGLLGTASKNKKLLDKDTAELIMVIGGLIANALSKALITRCEPQRQEPNRPEPHRSKLPEILAIKPDKAPAPVPVPADTVTESAPVTTSADTTHQEALVIPPVDDQIAEKTANVTAEKTSPSEKSSPPDNLKEEPAAVTATSKTPEAQIPAPASLPEKPAPFIVVKKSPVENDALPKPLKPADPAFHSHTRKMEHFSKTHKKKHP